MQALKCLIIEDEHLAAQLLSDYVHEMPGIELAGVCSDVFSAAEILRSSTVEILLVDINLPKVNGLEFIKTLKGNYQVILTTAYHEYALDGYALNVVDYLLKPIEFSRFVQAIHKALDRAGKALPAAPPEEKKFYFFNVDKKQVKLFASEIEYIESLKDYVKIHTRDKNIVTKFQIGELESFLNDKNFMRIHKSYIINLDKIGSYTSAEVEMENIRLPIGRTYKELLDKEIRTRSER